MAKRSTPGKSTAGGGSGSAPAPPHLAHLKKANAALATSDGLPITVYQFSVPAGDACLTPWAKHFRQNYCPDKDLDGLRKGTKLTRAEYLTQMVFPDLLAAPGPAIRSGDFAELLVTDYVEFYRGYWVPRGKYAEKESRNESAKGVDILGFKVKSRTTARPSDKLLTYEVKAQLSGNAYKGRLQDAIDDSAKDMLRSATSLNATKRRLLRDGKQADALVVQRFQNKADHPYVYKCGAAAVLCDSVFDPAGIQLGTNASAHGNKPVLELMVIRGPKMMDLVHSLYKKAADEA